MRAPEFWHQPPGLIAGLLTPFGIAFDAASRLRRAVARAYRPPVPVICVGNLVAGGSGKTPVVLSLAGILARRRIAVHVVSRGYGGRLAGPVRVDQKLHDAGEVGDEPLLLAAHAPCWVARDRAAGVRAAVSAGADAVLLDDGFQNPGVAKDLSLVVVDAGYGFGNRRVIPAGPLREPVGSGLARADAMIVIGSEAEAHRIGAAHSPLLGAELCPIDGERFAGARIVAFAGIGRPDKFFDTVRALGANIVSAEPFPDHHPFRQTEIARLHQTAKREGARLVTTAKDWVRLPPSLRAGIEVLDVEIRWRDADAVEGLLSSVLSPCHDRRDPGTDRG
jgi:tetraacyldisaccharide 4'-kinase